MKLVKGQTLKGIFELVCEGKEGWTQTRALGLILKVCEAMAYAHSKNVIHRDLKPGNIMVGRFGEVYVMDWGLARILGRTDEKDIRIREQAQTPTSSALRSDRHDVADDPESPLYTLDGDVVGTPAYMPPEQAEGRIEELGPHSDIYSVGAILYHLLSGQMPYVKPGAKVNNYMILRWVQSEQPDSLHTIARGIPAELVSICEKAMARNPTDRYSSIESLADDLRAFLEGRVVAAYETGAWAETRKWVQRNKPLAASVSAAVLLLVGGLATTLVMREESERLKNEAVVREAAATARADALWAIEELGYLWTLDDDLEYARNQDRPMHEWWLEQARELVYGWHDDPVRGLRSKSGLEDHRRLLERFRADTDEPRLEAVDREKEWWIANLARLVQDLDELRERIAVCERSVLAPDAQRKWSEAIESISRSPKYGGLRLAPQLELLPIGSDVDSGLWEFAHLTTGEPAQRGDDGKLTLTPKTGIVFVLLPAGRVPVEDGKEPWQLNKVLLDSFFISKYEITVAQWHRMRELGWPTQAPMLPVANVSWSYSVKTLEQAGLFLQLPTVTFPRFCGHPRSRDARGCPDAATKTT